MENKNNDPEFEAIVSNAKKSAVKFNNGLVWLIKFSISKAWVHVIFIVVGIAIGYGLFSISKPVYSASLTINNTRLKNDFCEELIGTISALRENKANDKILSKKLNLSLAIISQIKSISYKPINDKVDRVYNDSLNYTVPFKTVAKVYDLSILDSLQNSLMGYLEANEFVVKRKELDKKALENLDVKIDGELRYLDSLKQAIYKSTLLKGQNTGGVNITSTEDLARLNEVSIELYQRKLNTRKKIELNNSFEVIAGLESNVVYDGPYRNKLIGVFALLGYVISLIFLLWKDFNSKQSA